MPNKVKGNEALSEAMRGQMGTTREVFTNANGSNVVLERVGDKGKRDNSEGSPDPDFENEDEPEDEPEDEEDGGEGVDTGGSQPPGVGGDFIGQPTTPPPKNPTKPLGCGTKIEPKNPKKTTQKEPNFGGKTNRQNEKIKNVYEAMKAQIDEQLNHYYRTGKFTIDPTQMMNKVFHDIMGKYGYKSVFNNGFKNVAEKRTWVKKAGETWQQINPKQLAKKLKGKLTLNNIGKLLKLKPGTVNKLNQGFNLLKILKSIRSNPVRFIINAFTKSGGLSTEMGSLISALGNLSASDLLSYVITLLIA